MKKLLALCTVFITAGLLSEYNPTKSSFSYSIDDSGKEIKVCRRGKKYKTMGVAPKTLKKDDSAKDKELKEDCANAVELKEAYRKKTGTRCYYVDKFNSVVCKTEKGTISATENVTKSCKKGAADAKSTGDIGILEENGKLCKISKALMADTK